MRPRKQILLKDPNEARRSVTAFVLDNAGYRVLFDRGDAEIAAVVSFDPKDKGDVYGQDYANMRLLLEAVHAFAFKRRTRGKGGQPRLNCWCDRKDCTNWMWKYWIHRITCTRYCEAKKDVAA